MFVYVLICLNITSTLFEQKQQQQQKPLLFSSEYFKMHRGTCLLRYEYDLRLFIGVRDCSVMLSSGGLGMKYGSHCTDTQERNRTVLWSTCNSCTAKLNNISVCRVCTDIEIYINALSAYQCCCMHIDCISDMIHDELQCIYTASKLYLLQTATMETNGVH